MTQKAQALGMTRTVYHNASGLPDNDQVTTARDQAILGRAIQERFPRYYSISRPAPSPIAASRSAITTSCSAGSKASTASRPATPAPPASTWSPRCRGRPLHRRRRPRRRQRRQPRRAHAQADRATYRRRARPSAPRRWWRKSPPKADRWPQVAAGPRRNPGCPSATSRQRGQHAGAARSARDRGGPEGRPAPGSTEPIRPVMVKTLNVQLAPSRCTPLRCCRLAGRRRARTPATPRPPSRPALPSPRSSRCRPRCPVAPGQRPSQAPRRLDDPGRRLSGGAGSQAALVPRKSKAAVLAAADPFTETVQKGDTSSTAPASPGSTRIRPKPPANISSETTSNAWRSKTDVDRTRTRDVSERQEPPIEVLAWSSQRWRRRRTSLASLTRAARYVDPPWSGWSFFISERWARPMSSALAPRLKAKDLIGLLFRHFAAARRSCPRPAAASACACSRQPGSRRSRYAISSARLSSSISASKPISVGDIERVERRALVRPGENTSAHRAGVVIELHLEEGRAHARDLARALLRARAEAGRAERQPAEQAQARRRRAASRRQSGRAAPRKTGQAERRDPARRP